MTIQKKLQGTKTHNLTTSPSLIIFLLGVTCLLIYISRGGDIHYTNLALLIPEEYTCACPSVLLCFSCIDIGNPSQNAKFMKASMVSLVSWI